MISVSIPVKKHVKKYLVKKYGTVHAVSKKTFLGLQVLSMINDEVEESDRSFLGFDKYELDIPELYFNLKGCNINKHKRRFIGTCLEKLFFEDFYSFVDLELFKGKTTAMASIKLFLLVYDISENDLKLESMYRNYQRYSKEKITEKKLNTIAIK